MQSIIVLLYTSDECLEQELLLINMVKKLESLGVLNQSIKLFVYLFIYLFGKKAKPIFFYNYLMALNKVTLFNRIYKPKLLSTAFVSV